ncbi:type VI secretion system protein TssL, long form [Massilia sp. YMA4]|uniref:type VI secretion system protein TssL, long form n=1 Tax=Massilia sp. YMA4 TaxID=1593482 RepID=UPI001D0C5D1F|nr:type VI secretion system protein TssL, long form [Massilia sp. YMA4]
MNANDSDQPLQDTDRTMLVPRPNLHPAPSLLPREPAAAPVAAPVAAPPAASPVQPVQLHGAGLNPLVQAANPLLDLVPPLRRMATHPDVEGLRIGLVQAVRTFEAAARAARVDPELIAAARYALCTLLDETIASTPWGGGAWPSRSLLVTFHNEAFGGEKFFLILQKLSQNPQVALPALELMYVCLALGFEGRYRVLENGRSQLDALRERLLQMIERQRGPAAPELSVHWQGQGGAGEPLWRAVPVWIVAAGAAVLLLVLQLALSWRLGQASDPVFASLLSLKTAAPPAAAPAPARAPARSAHLVTFLAPEIAQGLVSVAERDGRSTITLRGDGVFASGSGEVAPAYLPLLDRIGAALATVPGRVAVVGHTDNVRPGLSARFPSNYELSRTRAETVRALLARRAGPPARYDVEGHGEAEPLVPNDTAANRARNRRVEIVVATPAA